MRGACVTIGGLSEFSLSEIVLFLELYALKAVGKIVQRVEGAVWTHGTRHLVRFNEALAALRRHALFERLGDRDRNGSRIAAAKQGDSLSAPRPPACFSIAFRFLFTE